MSIWEAIDLFAENKKMRRKKTIKSINDLTKYKFSEEEIERNMLYFGGHGIYNVCYYQELSENFIEKHKDKVYWDVISARQNLSKEFIIKHIDKINFDYLLKNYNISQEIKN